MCAGSEIAEALDLNYVFLCEFIEYRSPTRAKDAQGGGVHGNALLTKLDITAAEAVQHSHHPIDWTAGKHPLTKCALSLLDLRWSPGMCCCWSCSLLCCCLWLGRRSTAHGPTRIV